MKFLRRLWPPVVLVLLVATGIVLSVEHDRIMDWIALKGYKPSATIQQLGVDDTMTPYGTRLFYVNRPAIEDQVSFNKHCTNTSDQVIVLGCFTGNRRGIYLYTVTDSRLAGIEQVTAAHEMLHQAYDRLSKSEQTRINGLLQQYYDAHATDDIKAQFASYQKTEPDQLLNELHSVLGTEVANLPSALETYYQQYFTNRQKVARYYQQYEAEFTQRQQQISDYDDQLTILKAQIDVEKNDLTDRQNAITQQRSQLNAYLSSNQINTYNAAVSGFNSQIDAYRRELDSANALIKRYNELLQQRNAIAVQEQQLQQAIDSHVSSASAQ